jgi:hypothetical protein
MKAAAINFVLNACFIGFLLANMNGAAWAPCCYLPLTACEIIVRTARRSLHRLADEMAVGQSRHTMPT